MTRPATHSGEPAGYSAERAGARRAAPSWASLVLGYGCIVAGGLVAAVTGPLGLERGSWVAAYLVLVGGVAQLAFGWVPGALGRPAGGRSAWVLVAAWNLGNVLVITGTLTDAPVGVDAGSVLLVLALVLAIRDVRRARPARSGPGADPIDADPPASRHQALGRAYQELGRAYQSLGRAYLGLLIVLAVSIPVGIVLAHLR